MGNVRTVCVMIVLALATSASAQGSSGLAAHVNGSAGDSMAAARGAGVAAADSTAAATDAGVTDMIAADSAERGTDAGVTGIITLDSTATTSDAGASAEILIGADAGTSAPKEVSPPVIVSKPTWRPPAGLYLKEPSFSRRFPRIAVMFFMSGLSELAGAGVGAVTGCLVVPYGPQGCLPAFLYGALIGGLLGIPVGVATGGYLMDGNGSVYATFAGFIAGGAIDAALLAFVIYNVQTDSLRATFATIGFLLLPNLLSIFAYEMTSDTSRRYSEAMEQTHPKVSLSPLLAPGSNGGVVGGLSLHGLW